MACGGKKEEVSFLDPSDLNPGAGGEVTHDPNQLILDSDFDDGRAVSEESQIQRFFESTPYNRRSFLEYYTSNGVRAAGAVVASAAKYQINPVVLLTRLQMAGGLIGSVDYPQPASRVDYVFECGCDGQGTCSAEFAGLDRQLDCLAAKLALSRTQILGGGFTDGGWGPGVTTLALDGVEVTPTNAATAALYQFDPIVGEKNQRGGWLFAGLYSRYGRSLGYSGSVDPQVQGGWIGEACNDANACSASIDGRMCLGAADGMIDGYCSVFCDSTTCPSNPRKSAVACVDFRTQGGICMAICNPQASNCRPGYACVRANLFESGGEDEVFVCSRGS